MSKNPLLALTFALFLFPNATLAGPPVGPPHANQYGEGYDGLSGNWVAWAMSIPWSTNPIVDPDGSNAAIGQSRPVWFLAGNQGGTSERSIVVPAGVGLFFPIVNYFWVNTPELGDAPWSADQEAFARSVLAYFIDTAEDLVLEVDGKAVPDLGALRAASTVEVCGLPTDNVFGANAGPHECVADGFWALLPPLPVGAHTVHFEAALGAAPGFFVDVTYEIQVVRR